MGENKNIDIKVALVRTPVKITVDGKTYPNTQWNYNVVREYWKTDDPKVLDNLKDFSLDLG